MTISDGMSLATAALRKNVLRSALAMVGLVIGVAAVLTMVALGRGAQEEVTEEVTSAGTNLVFIRAGNYVRGGDALGIPSGLGKATTLTEEDASALATIPKVMEMTPVVEDRAPLAAGDATGFALVVGSNEHLPAIQGLGLARGRFFTDEEVRSAASVAVLGSSLSESLYGGADPVGKELLVRDVPFVVVGVATKGEDLYLPFKSLQKLITVDYLHGVTLSAETAGDCSSIGEEARRRLRERHGLDDPERTKSMPEATGIFAMKGSGRIPDDFTVSTEASRALTQGLYTPAAALALASMPSLDEVTSEEMATTLARANETMTFLLASIASVSLVVGGIGIMNVMLLSVTERTTEVGLRMSVGARTRDVLLQFLLEAVALSVTGGLLGILFGMASAFTLTLFLGWPTYVSAGAILAAVGLALGVGIVFGYYPAFRASRLDPIDALRYE
jgi:putative ABC transport system permease protein